MDLVRDLLATLKMGPQDVAGSVLSPHDRLDCLSTDEIRELARVAALELVERSDTPLGEMLPGLLRSHSQRVTSVPLKPRAYNALARAGVATWGDLAGLTPGQLFKPPNVGRLTVIDIVTSSVEQALRSHQAGDAVEDRAAEDVDGEFDEPFEPLAANEDQLEAAMADLRNSGTWGINVANSLGALRTLAAWGIRERDAKQLGDIIELTPESGPINADLSALWDNFGQVALTDWADPALLDVTLDELAERLFANMDERQHTIYRRRVIDGATLEVVGGELDVTRERIRQLQLKAERQIQSALRSSPFTLLHWRAADLRSSLGTTAPIAHDITQSALEKSLRGASQNAAELLRPLILRLAGPFRERDGWMTLEQADIPEPADIEAMADEFGVLPLVDARDWLAAHGIRPEFHDAWLEHSGRFQHDGDRLLVWSGSVVDKSVALLAALGEPEDTESLVALVGEGHNVRGVRARFFEDERLVRVNRTHWALRAWGMEDYTGITDEIAQRIEEAGGEIEVAAVVREVVSQFGVKENSVLVYTAAPMFVVEGDRIRLRMDDEPIDVGGSLENCAGAFRSSERSVSLLIPADADLMRGSGRPLSGSVAVALGVSPGRPRSFLHASGALNVTWPMTAAMGPSLGSARVLANAAGATAGERVRLDFDLEQGRVSAERIPQEIHAYEDAEAIRLLTGISTNLSEALVALAEAIGVPPANVRHALTERGDADLVSLLPVPDVDPRLASTLSDLARVISGS